jgi:hypothetical protein
MPESPEAGGVIPSLGLPKPTTPGKLESPGLGWLQGTLAASSWYYAFHIWGLLLVR